MRGKKREGGNYEKIPEREEKRRVRKGRYL